MPPRRDFYEVLEVARDASDDDIKKRLPQAGAQVSTPTAIPGDKDAEERFKECSRGLPDPLRSREARAVRSLRCRRLRGRRRRLRLQRAASRTSSAASSATSSAGARRRAVAAGRGAATTCATTSISASRRPRSAARRRSPCRAWRRCDDLRRAGRQARHQAEDVQRLPRLGPGALPAGLLQHRQDLRPVQRPGQRHRRPVPQVSGRRASSVSTQNLSVKIPAGVDTGSRLKLRGEGEAGGGGGPSGDLYVVDPRRASTRSSAARTATSSATSRSASRRPRSAPRSRCRPSRASTRCAFRPARSRARSSDCKGKGIADLRGYGRGDHVVRVVVETPRKLTKRQQRAARGVREELGGGGARVDAASSTRSRRCSADAGTLREVGEHPFLRALCARARARASHARGARLLVPPGDDCAVLAPGRDPLVVTTDALVEGVHFRSAWLSPRRARTARDRRQPERRRGDGGDAGLRPWSPSRRRRISRGVPRRAARGLRRRERAARRAHGRRQPDVLAGARRDRHRDRHDRRPLPDACGRQAG